MNNFDDLDFEITEETHPTAIYERSKENPNEHLSAPCNAYNGSLDEYAKQLAKEMFPKDNT